MPGMTLAGRSLLVAVLLACFAAAAVDTFIMDQLGVAAALAIPLGAIVAVLVAGRPVLGVQLALLAVPLEALSLSLGSTAGLSPVEILLLLTAGAALLRWLWEGRVPSVPPALRVIAAITVLVGLSLTVAVDQVAVTKILLMWSAFTIVGVLVADASESDVRGILFCVALAAGIVGAIAASGVGSQTLVGGGAVATNRAQGGFAQPNVLGFFLSMSIPLAIVQIADGPVWRRALMGVFLLFGVWGLMLSLSRTSLVGTALGLTLLLLWPSFRRVAVVALGALVLFALFNAKALEQSNQISVLSGRLETLTRANAVQGDPRWQIYRTARQIIGDHPVLGIGAGNFPVVSPRYGLLAPGGLPYQHAHDTLLTFGAELGIVGMLLLVWLAFAVARLCWSAIAARGDPRLGPLGLGLVAAMAAVVITNLGDYPPRTNVIAAAFVIEVGALAALARRRRA
jgi:O-antigen ligase